MSLFAELKRRNVFRVGIAYVVLAWILLQVGDTLAPALHLPEWINSALAIFLILGDRYVENLRDDPRYEAMVSKLGLRVETN